MNKGTKLLLAAIFSTGLLLSACDQSRNHATLQNSVDTGNTREGQHHDIPVDDTTHKKADSVANPSKGNADPRGHGGVEAPK
jgi:hypothetical protein